MKLKSWWHEKVKRDRMNSTHVAFNTGKQLQHDLNFWDRNETEMLDFMFETRLRPQISTSPTRWTPFKIGLETVLAHVDVSCTTLEKQTGQFHRH